VYAAYLAIAAGVGRTSQLLHRQNADVQGQALTDNLTGLPNRRHARSFLEREFFAAKRGNLLSVVLFDLDGFKAFNDLHGHRAGDRALARCGEILTATTRRMNLSSRVGGEEFLSVLSGSSEEGAVVFAERVREALESVRLPQGSLTVSAGVASYHPSIPSSDELIAAADLALYRAKREGRNCVRVFGTPEPRSEGQEDRRRDPHRSAAAPPTGDGVTTGPTRSEEHDPSVLIEAARAMVRAVERRAVHKSGRSSRVAGFAEILAHAAGLSIDSDALRVACELHDVGDIAVPSDVLAKKGPLTREELLQVQQHPVVGHRILQALAPDGEVLAAAKWHHERWDGSGYPEGLIGDTIPLAARVVAIADALDAMTSARPYRAPLPWQVAVEQISSLGGSQFDPALIERFRAILPELERLASASVPAPTEGD
jgi:diguanylate cyclase (GGDEF)-like protein